MKNYDLFDVVFGAISPYAFSILKLALAATLYTNSVRIIRMKKGSTVSGGSNPYAGLTTAFVGYLLGRGTPILIGITDKVCDGIVSTIGGSK